MPFVTEEMYQTYFKTIEKGDSIHTSSWDAGKKHTEKDFDNLHLLYKTLSDVRSEKTKMKVSMNHEITLTLPKDAFDTLTKAGMMEDLKHVTCAKEVKKDGAFHVI